MYTPPVLQKSSSPNPLLESSMDWLSDKPNPSRPRKSSNPLFDSPMPIQWLYPKQNNLMENRTESKNWDSFPLLSKPMPFPNWMSGKNDDDILSHDFTDMFLTKQNAKNNTSSSKPSWLIDTCKPPKIQKEDLSPSNSLYNIPVSLDHLAHEYMSISKKPGQAKDYETSKPSWLLFTDNACSSLNTSGHTENEKFDIRKKMAELEAKNTQEYITSRKLDFQEKYSSKYEDYRLQDRSPTSSANDLYIEKNSDCTEDHFRNHNICKMENKRVQIPYYDRCSDKGNTEDNSRKSFQSQGISDHKEAEELSTRDYVLKSLQTQSSNSNQDVIAIAETMSKHLTQNDDRFDKQDYSSKLMQKENSFNKKIETRDYFTDLNQSVFTQDEDEYTLQDDFYGKTYLDAEKPINVKQYSYSQDADELASCQQKNSNMRSTSPTMDEIHAIIQSVDAEDLKHGNGSELKDGEEEIKEAYVFAEPNIKVMLEKEIETAEYDYDLPESENQLKISQIPKNLYLRLSTQDMCHISNSFTTEKGIQSGNGEADKNVEQILHLTSLPDPEPNTTVTNLILENSEDTDKKRIEDYIVTKSNLCNVKPDACNLLEGYEPHPPTAMNPKSKKVADWINKYSIIDEMANDQSARSSELSVNYASQNNDLIEKVTTAGACEAECSDDTQTTSLIQNLKTPCLPKKYPNTSQDIDLHTEHNTSKRVQLGNCCKDLKGNLKLKESVSQLEGTELEELPVKTTQLPQALPLDDVLAHEDDILCGRMNFGSNQYAVKSTRFQGQSIKIYPQQDILNHFQEKLDNIQQHITDGKKKERKISIEMPSIILPDDSKLVYKFVENENGGTISVTIQPGSNDLKEKVEKDGFVDESKKPKKTKGKKSGKNKKTRLPKEQNEIYNEGHLILPSQPSIATQQSLYHHQPQLLGCQNSCNGTLCGLNTGLRGNGTCQHFLPCSYCMPACHSQSHRCCNVVHHKHAFGDEKSHLAFCCLPDELNNFGHGQNKCHGGHQCHFADLCHKPDTVQHLLNDKNLFYEPNSHKVICDGSNDCTLCNPKKKTEKRKKKKMSISKAVTNFFGFLFGRNKKKSLS